MNDYQATIQEAVSTLSAKSAVSVLSAASKDSSIKLDRETRLKLSYVRIISLSVNQLTELMKESVLIAYQLPEYVLSEQIEKYAELLFDPALEIDMYRALIPILEANEELLGPSTIQVKGEQVPATISNWIKDYNEGEQHDPLNQIKYVNGSANVKLLDEPSRKVLLDILKIYDKSISMVKMWDEIEIPEEGQLIPNNYDMSILIPDLEEDDGKGGMDALMPKEQQETVQLENRIASDFKIPLAKDIDLKTMPKRGLVFDQQTNVDVSTAAEENKEDEIQAKLEELKKRKGQ